MLLRCGDNISLIRYIQEYISDLYIFNINTLLDQFIYIPIHPIGVNYNSDILLNQLEFDMTYANYILSNDKIFISFMDIIMPLYSGSNVLLLIDNNSEFSTAVGDSLNKLIQERYGICTFIINEPIDISYINEDYSRFTKSGLFNLDCDRRRLMELVIKNEQPVILERQLF